MSDKIKCPYCGFNMTHAYRDMKEDSSEHVAALCNGCGEPVMREPGWFRKPTADEHIYMMQETDIGRARTMWLKMKELQKTHEDPPLFAEWRRFQKHVEKAVPDNMAKAGVIRAIIAGTFLAGAMAGISVIRKAFDDTSGFEEWMAANDLLDKEVDDFKRSLVSLTSDLEGKLKDMMKGL